MDAAYTLSRIPYNLRIMPTDTIVEALICYRVVVPHLTTPILDHLGSIPVISQTPKQVFPERAIRRVFQILAVIKAPVGPPASISGQYPVPGQVCQVVDRPDLVVSSKELGRL